MSHKRRPPRGGGRPAGGVTLMELMVAAAILGIIFLPIARFIGQTLKSVLKLETRHQAQDLTRYAMVDVERDFKDMNELVFGSSSTIIFYMDSHRRPGYDRNANEDNDGVPNGLDPDDDNDGFSGIRSARDYLALAASNFAISTAGWRHGFDLQDDDDDNDGFRDVACRYRYDSASQRLVRDFRYNESDWTDLKVVVENVVDFKFEYFWDPNTKNPISGALPAVVDLPSASPDGIFNQLDLDGELLAGGCSIPLPNYCNGVLDQFSETTYVVGVSYSITLKPKPTRPDTFTSASALKPPLMGVKEKYP